MSSSLESLITLLIWVVAGLLGFVLLRRWLRNRSTNRTLKAPPQIVALEATKMLEIRAAVEKHQFIQALKLYKEASGLGLKESRDALNYLMKNGWQLPPTAVAPISPSSASMAQVEALVQRNQLIEAIKMYRQLVECDLKTAKEAVEALAAKQKQR